MTFILFLYFFLHLQFAQKIVFDAETLKDKTKSIGYVVLQLTKNKL